MHPMTFTRRSFVPLLAAALLAACDGRETSLGPGLTSRDRTAPTIVSTTPSDLATQVFRTSAISVTFSEPMTASSITRSTFVVSPDIVGMVSYSNNTATLTPTSQLAANTVYTVTVTTAAEDRAGNHLATARTWTFTTGSGAP
jgi:hypothetical protein